MTTPNLQTRTRNTGVAISTRLAGVGQPAALPTGRRTAKISDDNARWLHALGQLGDAAWQSEFTKALPHIVRALAAFESKYGLAHFHLNLGFDTAKEFIAWIKQQREWLRDKAAAQSAQEFRTDLSGRMNHVIGIELFERFVKHGPFAGAFQKMSVDAINGSNRKIETSKRITMLTLFGDEVAVTQKFTAPIKAKHFLIEGEDRARESVDLMNLSFLPDGRWAAPCPVEIKMRRAARDVGAQFRDYLGRMLIAALENQQPSPMPKLSAIATLDAEQFAKLRKLAPDAKFDFSVEDGGKLFNIRLPPEKMLVQAAHLDPVSDLNQVVVMPIEGVAGPFKPPVNRQYGPADLDVQPRISGEARTVTRGTLAYRSVELPFARAFFEELAAIIFLSR